MVVAGLDPDEDGLARLPMGSDAVTMHDFSFQRTKKMASLLGCPVRPSDSGVRLARVSRISGFTR